MEIGALAKQTGVSRSAIRYYEAEKILPKPRRVSGRRIYEASAIARLRLIHTARSLGFTIRELKVFSAGIGNKPSVAWRKLVESKIADFDQQFSRMSRMRAVLADALECGCSEIIECRKAFEQ